MSPWDSLPNGKRIDAVLEFAKHNRKAARVTAPAEVRIAARSTAWAASRDAARDEVWDAVWDAARDAERSALLALVAFDYAGDLYDDISVAERADHTGDPAAVLLLPMLRLMKETKKEITSQSILQHQSKGKPMSKHTPGPWKVRRSHYSDSYRYVQIGKEREYTTLDLLAADARLIAAAPDLYESLQDIVDAADGNGWDQLDATFTRARAALKKVRGER